MSFLKKIKNTFLFKKYKKKYDIKIYDCFLFFNENDILEIRLNELNSIIDYFVILESNTTFSKNGKPFFFDKKRFDKFKNKIIYIQNTETIKSVNPWETEKYQRNKLATGLNLPYLPIQSKDNDMIILSDLDEIIKKDILVESFFKLYKENNKYIRFYLNTYCYALNNKANSKNDHGGPICFKKENIGILNNLRTEQNADLNIHDAGWHYSFMGSAENIVFKLKSYSHQEFNKWPNTDVGFINQRIKSGNSNFEQEEMLFKKVKLSKKNCPNYVLKNINKYDKLIFDYEKTSMWTQIMSIYNKKICKIKEYCLGIRNKFSKKNNKI